MKFIQSASGEFVGVHRAPAGVGLLAAAVFAALRTWWRLGGENHHLRGLGDRELRDIGLSRVDAWAAARKPRWPEMVAAARKVLREGPAS